VICVDVSDDALTFQTDRVVNAEVPIAA